MGYIVALWCDVTHFVRWSTVYLAVTAASVLMLPIHIPEDNTVWMNAACNESLSLVAFHLISHPTSQLLCVIFSSYFYDCFVFSTSCESSSKCIVWSCILSGNCIVLEGKQSHNKLGAKCLFKKISSYSTATEIFCFCD